MTRPRQRSEEHTSELQSRSDLVCRLLLEKKKSRPGRGAREPALVLPAVPAPAHELCEPQRSECILVNSAASGKGLRVFFFFKGSGDTGFLPSSPPPAPSI